MSRICLVVLAAALAAGCGSASSGGQATLWVTRDRGSQVLHSTRVPAGLTAVQALARVAKVKTRYGGRYVRSVDGISEHGRDSWFYYVNGYLADRSAADYRLHDGDVEWWDYRGWRDPLDDDVVVGAFPEPFRHGYGGERRRAVVVSGAGGLARQVARLVGARVVAGDPPAGANVIELRRSVRPRFSARLSSPRPGAPVRFVLDAAFARRLLDRPTLARYRYAVP